MTIALTLLAATAGAAASALLHWWSLRRVQQLLAVVSENQALIWKYITEINAAHSSLTESHRILATVALSDLPDTARGPSVPPWPAD